MIILSETTDNIQVVLGGTVAGNQLRCYSSWRDRTSTTFVAGRTVVNTNDTNDVNIVPAPAASTQRVVDFISIYNLDSNAATVTIKFDVNGTEYVLFKTTISADERIEYAEGTGWKVYNNLGAVKQSINQGNNVVSTTMSAVVLNADVTNNNSTANTIANVVNLAFPVTSGDTYWFRFIIWFTAAATTTGSRWSINGPANSLLGYRTSVGLSAAGTAGTDVMTDVNQGAYDTPSASNATSPTATAGQANIAIIEGLISASANGSVTARFASEISNSAIVAKAGSVVYYQRVI